MLELVHGGCMVLSHVAGAGALIPFMYLFNFYLINIYLCIYLLQEQEPRGHRFACHGGAHSPDYHSCTLDVHVIIIAHCRNIPENLPLLLQCTGICNIHIIVY